MTQLESLKKHLKRGRVYRRADLANWSRSVDRHLSELVREGTLKKLSQGLYAYPTETPFGEAPPDDDQLVRSFLKDDRFLITSLNAYNALGVGTTQLYNKKVVYNHKRHGEFKMGNRAFDFRIKHHFPHKITQEFLLVDLLNNLDTLAEERTTLLRNISRKVASMNTTKLAHSVALYGNIKTKKLFVQMRNNTHGTSIPA
jgi:Family of unknown function (DUF6088)